MNGKMKSGKVIVLGCGPAGLLAAYAVTLANGYSPVIVSNKRKSEMFGAQYLHEPIPGLTEVSAQIDYQLRGTAEEYRRKVYGQAWSGTVSPEEYGDKPHVGYDLRHVYNSLWEKFHDSIIHVKLRSGQDMHGIIEGVNPEHIISTLPAPALCIKQDEHVFRVQQVWAVGDAPERGIFCPVKEAPANSIICSGERDVSWYRTANIFGYRTCEWPFGTKPPLPGISAVRKPLSTTCSCWQRVARMGRYGRWQKGVLAHSAYYDTLEMLEAR